MYALKRGPGQRTLSSALCSEAGGLISQWPHRLRNDCASCVTLSLTRTSSHKSDMMEALGMEVNEGPIQWVPCQSGLTTIL